MESSSRLREANTRSMSHHNAGTKIPPTNHHHSLTSVLSLTTLSLYFFINSFFFFFINTIAHCARTWSQQQAPVSIHGADHSRHRHGVIKRTDLFCCFALHLHSFPPPMPIPSRHITIFPISDRPSRNLQSKHLQNKTSCVHCCSETPSLHSVAPDLDYFLTIKRSSFFLLRPVLFYFSVIKFQCTLPDTQMDFSGRTNDTDHGMICMPVSLLCFCSKSLRSVQGTRDIQWGIEARVRWFIYRK